MARLLRQVSACFQRLIRTGRASHAGGRPPGQGKANNAQTTKLPAPPRDLIDNREKYEVQTLSRITDPETDTPLAALYRLYEHIVLDQHIELRNELEAFWFQHAWPVAQLPDPRDTHPERYAVLAAIPALLVAAFNRRIALGLPRDAPPVFTGEQLEAWRAGPRELEREPEWAQRVAACVQVLAIPHWDNELREFVVLNGFDDDRISEAFQKKNILIWQPHIHFI